MQPVKLENARILADYAQKSLRILIHLPHSLMIQDSTHTFSTIKLNLLSSSS
jgi:hypothetical protein